MKLSEWAEANGIRRKTAYTWFHSGILPVPAVQLPTGTILVQEPRAVGGTGGSVALYARVSSADQKDDLDRQLGRLAAFAAGAQLAVTNVVSEIGSGMNAKRPKLCRLLTDPTVSAIVVEHRDRLCRFGFEYIEAALSAQGRRIVVADDTELTDDLVRDVTEVLTSLCARLYGRRSAKHRAEAALAAARTGAQEVPRAPATSRAS